MQAPRLVHSQDPAAVISPQGLCFESITSGVDVRQDQMVMRLALHRYLAQGDRKGDWTGGISRHTPQMQVIAMVGRPESLHVQGSLVQRRTRLGALAALHGLAIARIGQRCQHGRDRHGCKQLDQREAPCISTE